MAVSSTPSAVVAEQLCMLCGLPIRSPVYEKNGANDDVFCCSGCLNVWRILVESGQLSGVHDPRDTPLYRQALAAGIVSHQPERSAPSTPTTVEVTQERKGGALDDNRQCILQIDGMWCASCSWLIEQSLLRTRGVVSAEVSFASDTARVVYKPAKTDETCLSKVVTDLGYAASPMGESNDSDPRVKTRRKEFLRVVICLAFAMNVMMMQLILYAGFFEGLTRDIRVGLPWLLLALSIPCLVTSFPIFRRAVQAAGQGAATMETLVAIGATSAFVYSFWQTLAGTGVVYYDTADMLLGLVMLGKFIESGARQNAFDALTLLYGLLPRKATLLRDGRETPVAIEQLTDGDMVIVKAGERIAADGTIEDGAATVDESLLSGESRPVGKCSGERAIGGSMLMDGVLTIKVDRTGDTGTLSLIIKHVEEALRTKTVTERLADRISRVFVPAVLCIAVVSATVLWVFGHASAGEVITRLVAVLVIACPCALGIATPMAISAGVGSAARSGMLISDGGAFELLRRIDHVVLDKTGTVTEASFEIRHVMDCGGDTSMLAALQGRSGHPIAAAVAAYFSQPGTNCPVVTDFQIDDGMGVSGTIDGARVFAGNENAAIRLNAELTSDQCRFAEAYSEQGLTVIYWGIAGERVLGVIALGDALRPGAAEAIEGLTVLGISTELLSGDSVAVTAHIAAELGIKAFCGAVSPSEKATRIAQLKTSGARVCMVGDGINDAPALAQANVGIALASGTDLAAKTSQVTLLKPDLMLLPKLIVLSRRTVSIVHMNLFCAFVYNTISIPLAALGYVTPLWAVVAMILSSLTVIANTRRLGRH